MPAALGIMMKDKDPAKIRRVMEVLLKMVKLDANALEKGYRGPQRRDELIVQATAAASWICSPSMTTRFRPAALAL